MRKLELRRFVILVISIGILSLFLVGLPIIGKIGLKIESLFIIIGIIIFWSAIIIGGFLINKTFNLYMNLKNRKNIYYRDIPGNYTPAIASLIYDNTYESSLDIPATILSLVGKKILQFDDNLNIRTIKTEKVKKLDNHEKYLYNCLKNGSKIDSAQFKNHVINDALAKNLIKKKEDQKDNNQSFIFFFIMFCVLALLGSMPRFPGYNVIAIILIAVTIIGTAILSIKEKNASNNNYENTLLGNEEKVKLSGLKHFLLDFSDLDSKEEKYIYLWEEYLAYAYMFGINNTIFNKFLNDKKYQKIFDTEYDIL